MTAELLEAWHPKTRSLEEVRGDFLDDVSGLITDGLAGEPGMVFATDRGGISALGSLSAKPHHDPDFHPWSVLWVLQASHGHNLFVADHVPKGYGDTTRRPTRSPQWSQALLPGQLVLFCAHRTHWMEPAEDGSVMVAGTFEFKDRPSRADVEATIEVAITRWIASKSAATRP